MFRLLLLSLAVMVITLLAAGRIPPGPPVNPGPPPPPPPPPPPGFTPSPTPVPCTSAMDCSNHARNVSGYRPGCTCYCLPTYHGKTCNVTYTLTPSDALVTSSVSTTHLASSMTHSVLLMSFSASHSTTTTLPCSTLLDGPQVNVSLSPLLSPLISSSSNTSSSASSSSYTMLEKQISTSEPVDSGNTRGIIPVTSMGIDRRTLTSAGDGGGAPTIFANLTIHASGQHATGLRVKNVTLYGNLTLQHTYPYHSDSWHVVTVAPPLESGWMTTSLWQPTTIVLEVHTRTTSNNAARSAVISNLVLVCIVGL
ncbi:GPI-anchored surface protein, putative [Bodo saltans]|uniref:GPI-anchored surface protein, putative n=1 Tax=Bodo saltans TaxID=75058 RepID=A0A0S4JU76_BODSA|nr:GPI-anchored surface protein, putative [Bodo saltans]|eukprot:CUG93764.1 GPI-anchored surface protein, putative [Bodo saltans]